MKIQNLKLDQAQLPVSDRLNLLALELNKKSHFFSRLVKISTPPRGLYIHGEVGRGKTMLMDLFYEAIATPQKKRIHFHAFMQDLHAKRATLKSNDIIAVLADDVAAKAKLLCLDEMQIVDIADAMIVGRLFDALLKRGVCIVTTSNVPPDGLYKDGLNRHLFLPFIAKLNAAFDIINLAAGQDYRLGRMANHKSYLTPLGKATDIEFAAIWNDLTDGAEGQSEELEFLGRKLHVPGAAHGCARFTFADLCESPLAAPDYLALAQKFRTIFVAHIPALRAAQRNETKRFILMIDTFYDQKVKLVMSSEAVAENLCNTGPYKFEFKRTASRLQEMQSASWWKAT
jgi:cell division protein ZapE